MPESESSSRSPLPGFFERSASLVWTAIVPQLILLMLNLRAFDLIRGEMTPDQFSRAGTFFGMEATLLAGMSFLAWILHRRQATFSSGWGAVVLVAHVAFLWISVGWAIGGLIPTSVGWWILNEGDLMSYQFTFMMPALFHGALRLACFPVRCRRGKDAGYTTLAVIGVPALWYLLLQSMRWTGFDSFFPVAVVVVLFAGSTLVILLGVIRLMAVSLEKFQVSTSRGRMILALIVALAAPLGGLWLNHSIPFPANFQDLIIYILTGVNGLFLLIPPLTSLPLQRLVAAGRAACFSFTLYFFVVFLPFLPLALLAIMAAGAGFLILAPTALFLLHASRLAEDFRMECARSGRGVALLIASAVLVIPAWITTESVFDRVTIDRAIQYVYEPDYLSDEPPRVSGSSLARSLDRLKEWKDAEPLPYLSDFYGWVVFDNLVLPDEKINQLHRVFLGSSLPNLEPKSSMLFGRRGRRSGNRWRPRPARELPHDVRITRLSTSTESDGLTDQTMVTIELKNENEGQSEWSSSIEVPDGVQVTGYWLNVGNERVPGRIFERKTAIWIYKMIRDFARRDPGLLVWKDPGRLELRVFPFSANESRTTQLEFSFPAAWRPVVHISGQAIQLGKAETKTSKFSLSRDGDGRGALLVPASGTRLIPSLRREPYLHFLIDRSSGTPDSLQPALHRCMEISKQFPEIRDAMVTVCNYESVDLTGRPVPIDAMMALDLLPAELKLPPRGGFCRDRAIKRALLQYHGRFRIDPPSGPWLLRHPLLVVIRQSPNPAVTEDPLAWFAKLVPDVGHYWNVEDGKTPEAVEFGGKKISPEDTGSNGRPIHLIRLAGQNSAAATAKNQPLCFDLQGLPKTADVHVYDPKEGHFRETREKVTVIPENTRFGKGMLAWLQNLELIFQPFRSREELPQVLEAARQSGTLTPGSAYIVVENTAQWKMLERKEKQKLRNAGTLEVMESPEPSIWALLALFLLLAAGRRWFIRSRP